MLIDKDLIVMNMYAQNKNDVIKKLCEAAEKTNKVDSAEKFSSSVYKREESFTTGIGNGIAIPHGKSNAVKEPLVAFAKLKSPIEWDSLDGKPVNMVFLLGVPDGKTENIHLKILASLSRKLMDNSFVQKLKCAQTVQDIYLQLSEL